MKVIGWIFVGIVVLGILLSLAFGLTWLGIEWHGFFGPKREAVRREVFEQTQSWNRGKLQELAKLKLEYVRSSDPIEKEAIANMARQAFANLPPERVTDPGSRRFLDAMMNGQTYTPPGGAPQFSLPGSTE